MSSLSSIIRAVAGGSALKPRAEGDEPEEMEDDDAQPDAAADDPEEMEDDDAQPDAAGDDPDPEAEDDETDGQQMSAGARRAYAAGMAAQQRRMAAILGAPEADGNPKLAAHLAFATNTSAKDARAMLKAGGSAPDVQAGGDLTRRMQSAPNPKVGGGGSGSKANDQPSRIFAAASAMIAAKRGK